MSRAKFAWAMPWRENEGESQRYDKGCHKAAYCAASEQYTFLLERERDHAAA